MRASDTLHRALTELEDQVLELEIGERRCGVCQRARRLQDGRAHCTVGKRFPLCRGERGGFLLRED